MPFVGNGHRKEFPPLGLRRHLVVLQMLIFALPLMVILYLYRSQNVVLESSQLLLVAMVLVLVLAGMMMLRQVFERFFGLASVVEAAETAERNGPMGPADAEEFRRMTFSFSRLMKRFERTTDELKRRVFELFAIRDLTEVASRVLDIDALLSSLLEKAMEVTGARIGSVFFYDHERQRLRVVDHRGLTPGPARNAYIRINKTVLGEVIRRKKPMLITDIEADPRTHRANDPRYGAPSFLAMPILARSGVIAVLSLANKSDARLFDADDERILSIIMQEIGFAVENATLHSAVENHARQLEESEAKYRSILESIQFGYYETDLERRLTFFNEPLLRLLGVSSADKVVAWLRSNLDKDNLGRLREATADVLEKGRPLTAVELSLPVEGGRFRFLEASIFLMRDAAGEPTGFRGMVRDITERRMAEVQQKRLEARLEKSQRLEAVGTLAGGVAHNFNNLLMGIQGNAELLHLHKGQAGGGERQLANIERLVKDGARLTGQLLGYAREGKYEPRPVDLNLLARDLAETFTSTCKNIRFQHRLASGLPAVIVDPGQMTQVMMNVMLNATEAMATGGTLTIETAPVASTQVPSDDFEPVPGDFVRVSFADTGRGMDSQTLDRAFEPFFTTKGCGQHGRGMGLASVYGIVKAHDGTVDILSDPGKGTVVSIYLPAAGTAVAETEPKAAAPAPKGEGTILMVDDEEIVLEVGAMMLRNLGYEVFEASGGRRALELLERHRAAVDLVILDMIMPEMSGEAAYERIRAVAPKVRVLLSSGYSRDGKADQLLARGCDAFIQKPFGLSDLAKCVAALMEKGAAAKLDA